MSWTGFRPRNHPKQTGVRGPDRKADERRTPPSVYDPLHVEHGFTLDAAASAENAKCPRYFSEDIDALSQSWAGEVVWCNPPYSNLYDWAKKALDEVWFNGCRKVVMLLPANRTEQGWWQELIEPVRDRPGTGVTTRNLRGRLVFGGDYKRNNTHVPFGSALVIIEPRNGVKCASEIDPRDPQWHGRPLWVIYGPKCFATFICAELRAYDDKHNLLPTGTPGPNVCIWGYSVYKREPGFRTLGISITELEKAHFFAGQDYALKYLAKLTTPLGDAGRIG